MDGWRQAVGGSAAASSIAHGSGLIWHVWSAVSEDGKVWSHSLVQEQMTERVRNALSTAFLIG